MELLPSAEPAVAFGPDLTLTIGDDDLLAVFDQLLAKDLLRSAALVCKRWRDLAMDDSAWQPRFSSTAPKGGAGGSLPCFNPSQQLPLRKLYAVVSLHNMLSNPGFQLALQAQNGRGAMTTAWPWTTTKIGGQGWQWVDRAVGMAQPDIRLPAGHSMLDLPRGRRIGAIESSYQRSEMVQAVDLVPLLVKRGLTVDEAEALLDSSPVLELSVYIGSRSDCSSKAQVWLVVDDGGRVLPTYVSRDDHPWHEDALAHTVYDTDDDPAAEGKLPHQGHWLRYTSVLQGYPTGARRALLALRGQDCPFWAGNYGAKFSAPQLRFLLPSEVDAAVQAESLGLQTADG